MSDLPMNPKPPGMSLPILTGPPKAKDPVCGMSVDPTKAAGKIAHNGKTYYFCSKRCEERFTQEPEKFLAAPGTVGMEHEEEGQPPRISSWSSAAESQVVGTRSIPLRHRDRPLRLDAPRTDPRRSP